MTRNDATRRPENHVIVLFGATGDLARRKLLPGLFHLHAAGLLPREYRVIGSAPAAFALTGRQFRAHAQEAAEKFGMTKQDDPSWTDFEQRLSFAIAEPGNVGDLQAVVRRAEAEIGGSPRRLFHLATPPEAFTSMVGMLGDSGLAHGATRVIIEKPFGTDLDSARTLNQAVHAVAMGASCQVITLGFHRPPLRMFRAHFPDAVRQFNEIVIDFADPGSISAEFLVKVPGAEMRLGGTKIAFSYKNSFAMSHALEGYERLILLAMTGDQSLFTRSDGIERRREISAPLLDNPPPVEPCEPGSWGPPCVDRLIAPFLWHLPES
jgi:glucose-6-phosphate 1-dehydrogenase